MAVPAEGHSLPVLHFEHRPEPILKAAQEYQSMPAAILLCHSEGSSILTDCDWLVFQVSKIQSKLQIPTF